MWWDGRVCGDWESLGAVLVEGEGEGVPCTISWGFNRIDLFHSGTVSKVYHKWWDGHNWAYLNKTGKTLEIPFMKI
jgi:hypothetical protein